MLIQQIMEFELRRPRPLIIHAQLLQNWHVFFHGKTKLGTSTLRVIYNLLLKILQ